MEKVSVVIADASALIALINDRDPHHEWAVSQAEELPAPFVTCESALSETFYVLGDPGVDTVLQLLRRGGLKIRFELAAEIEPVAALMEKYRDVPMSLADACIVRMTETLSNPLVLTTDSDFRVYRRLGRQVVPCRMP